MDKDLKELTETEYRELPFESFSSLNKILTSVAEYKHYKANPFKGNAASDLGTAIHNAIQNNEHLIGVLTANRRSIIGKEAVEKFIKEFTELHNGAGVIVTEKQHETIKSVVNNYQLNKKATELVQTCEFEVPFVWTAHDMFSLKGRVDLLNIETGIVGEIKTTTMANSVSEFRDMAYMRNYDMQAALYKIMAESTHNKPFKHYFIVCNTKSPFNVLFIKTSDAFLKSGEEKLFKAIRLYDKHILKGIDDDTTEEV
jgi:hypothetical protein